MTSAIVLVAAHAGHWLEFALFAPPAVLVLTATVRSLRDGRAQRRAAAPPDPPGRVPAAPGAGKETP